MPTVWPTWVGQGPQTGGTYFGTTNMNTWNVWVGVDYGTTGGTAMTIQPQVWDTWLGQPQTMGTASQVNVWLQWQGTASPVYTPGQPPAVVPPQPPTAEELAQRKRQSLIFRNRARASEIRRKIAARRAEKLLLENLNDTQREEWGAEHAFTVHTADGKRAYKIAYGLAGNVRLVKAEEAPLSKHGRPLSVGARFCMHVYHPDGQVPHEDNVLAQKLLIEANERGFLDLANVS